MNESLVVQTGEQAHTYEMTATALPGRVTRSLIRAIAMCLAAIAFAITAMLIVSPFSGPTGDCGSLIDRTQGVPGLSAAPCGDSDYNERLLTVGFAATTAIILLTIGLALGQVERRKRAN